MTDSYLGIDIGTSGIRAIQIDPGGQILASARATFPGSQLSDGMLCQQPDDWWRGVLNCLQQLAEKTPGLGSVQALAIDGTSGTTLLTDAQNQPLSPALMYNDVRPESLGAELTELAPGIPAGSRSSSLAKAVWLQRSETPAGEYFIQQQADWILAKFRGTPGFSDWNNALKLGFDTELLSWPDWLNTVIPANGHLPAVHRPGKTVATIAPAIARQTGLPPTTRLHAGTTDSIAAFLASGASQPGDAATSLGSTLVLKLCTQRPVTSAVYGIYSHRLDETRWLAGGASNTGGAVLKNEFSNDELNTLSAEMDTDNGTGLDYYPLPAPGERFPFPDADKQPVMTPKPANQVTYLQAIFEGIARIEKQGYDLLEELSSEKVRSVRSCGGGAANPAWTSIRQRILQRPLIDAAQTEAAYGSALLAAGKL